MRRVRRQHNYERRDQLPAPRSLLPQFIDVLHHRRDRRVVLQRLGIRGPLADRAMELLLELRRRRAFGAAGFLSPRPHLLQQAALPPNSGAPAPAPPPPAPYAHHYPPNLVHAPP